jgi:hypothetical protein
LRNCGQRASVRRFIMRDAAGARRSADAALGVGHRLGTPAGAPTVAVLRIQSNSARSKPMS